MSESMIKTELENRGIKPDQETIETITWFKQNNPEISLDEIIESWYWEWNNFMRFGIQFENMLSWQT